MLERTKNLPRFEAVEIIDIAQEGKGIAKVEDLVIFVDKVVPGDIVDIQVLKKKKNLAEGTPSHFHQFSQYRQTAFCEHFGTCGGCKWQHMNYERQLFFKQKAVQDALTRLVKIQLPPIRQIIGSEQIQNYRNKLEYSFSNKRWLTAEEIKQSEILNKNAVGFHVPKRFDKIIDINKCHLQDDRSNVLRNTIRQYAIDQNLTFYDIREQHGLLRNMIIRNTNLDEWMLVMVFGEQQQEKIQAMMTYLLEQFSWLSSLQYIVNLKKNDTIYDQELVSVKGDGTIMEQMTDLHGNKIRFQVSAKSFYQTNSAQAEQLYHLAGKMAKISSNDLVYDLYTGTGTIANFIASSAKQVIGIEYVEDAIIDAEANSRLNGISNTKFFAGDMKDLLTDAFALEHGKPDVIITDPPRAGMHEDVCKQLLKLEPKRIVYVSCNASTQARDLGILDEKYAVVDVQPVDMFPHTDHVENIVSLELK